MNKIILSALSVLSLVAASNLERPTPPKSPEPSAACPECLDRVPTPQRLNKENMTADAVHVRLTLRPV